MRALVRCRSWAILKRVCFLTRPGPARYSTTVQHASTWLVQVGFALQLGSFETIETIILFCTLRRLSTSNVLPSPSPFPLSPRRQGLRTLRMLWIACLQFEMSGDVRSYETVVMIWNVDETIIGKILILIGTYDSIIWRIYLVTDKSTCVGKETCQATLSEQWRICPWHKVQKLWSNNGTRTDDDNCHQESRWWADDQKAFNYSYSLYLLHFHHIAGRQKGSWFLPLLLLRLLSLLFLLLVKLYDTFCFRKDWKLQRVRSTWLTMCGQMVVLGA